MLTLLTLHGDKESTVQTDDTVRLEDGGQAVAQTGELTVSTLADVSSQTGTGKVQRVDEAQRGGSGSSTRGQVGSEELPRLSLAVDSAHEDALVLILEGKVQSLGWEVSQHVCPVASPE